MKFEWEIDKYFSSLGKDKFAFIRNSFTANARILQAGTGTQEELVKLQHNGFACDVYSEKNLCELLMICVNFYDVQLIPINCYTYN